MRSIIRGWRAPRRCATAYSATVMSHLQESSACETAATRRDATRRVASPRLALVLSLAFARALRVCSEDTRQNGSILRMHPTCEYACQLARETSKLLPRNRAGARAPAIPSPTLRELSLASPHRVPRQTSLTTRRKDKRIDLRGRHNASKRIAGPPGEFTWIRL